MLTRAQHNNISVSDAKINQSEDIISAQLRQLRPLIERAVGNSIFRGPLAAFPNFNVQEVDRICLRVETVALDAAPQLVRDFISGMPDFLLAQAKLHPNYAALERAIGQVEVINQVAQDVVYGQVLAKAAAFCTALGIHEMPAEAYGMVRSQLRSFVGMYGGDQTMDRDDEAMVRAVSRIDMFGYAKPWPVSDAVMCRLSFLSVIGASIEDYCLLPELQIVRHHFYGDVLGNELLHRQLTKVYEQSANTDRFWREYCQPLAEITTVSAGFPTVSSSWYAIFRRLDPTLPTLPELYQDPAITKLEQVCNVVARLLDELGDWEMDAGLTDMGVFVINPCNQYHPGFIDAYADLGDFHTEARQSLHSLFRDFHHDRQGNTDAAKKLLRRHIRQQVGQFQEQITAMPAGPQRRGYERYLTLCKRVIEICFVNAIGDPALANPRLKG